jgi:hypothetical protein
MSNAELTSRLGISCGTMGIGLDYALYNQYLGFDVGVPFNFGYNFEKNDTTFTKNEFTCNSYTSLNVIVDRKLNYDIAVGITLFTTISYENVESGNDTLKNRTGNNIIFDGQIGPCVEYLGKNEAHENIFSIQLFPFKFYLGGMSKIKAGTSVQFNYYLKKFGK